jgi:drug/metabolite transporter (DMT)-like permease
MAWFAIAALSSLTFGLGGFFMKVSAARRGSVAHLLLGLYLTGTLGFLIWMWKEGTFRADVPTLVGGLLLGLGSTLGNVLFMKALDHGPASLTTPLVNTNILLIILFSVIVYGERLSWFETAGVTLLVLAILLIPIDRNEKLAIRNPRWYALVLTATLLFSFRNGGLKVTQEMHIPGTPVLFYGYVLGLIWFVVEILRQPQSGDAESRRAARTGLFWGLLCGIFSFLGMQLYSIALIDGPASIVAPMFATNSLIVAILSILIYRERLSLLQTCSLVFLFTGLILIRL